MRGVSIVCVGRLKEKYLREAAAEYEKRLAAYFRTEVLEVADERAPESLSEAGKRQVLEKEGARILARIPEKAYVIALAPGAAEMTSEAFAAHLQRTQERHEQTVFVIGGSLGLSEKVYARADETLGFSPLTFPHQLMRVILLEQLYRSAKINHGEPYHK